MDKKLLLERWKPFERMPELSKIPKGDMPGDKMLIEPIHLRKANCIIPALLSELADVVSESPSWRAVISVCGGSGVGKTETAALIVYALDNMGLGAYAISGDNYAHRIPKYNDAERLNIFRISGIKELIASGIYSEEIKDTLFKLKKSGADADSVLVEKYPWLAVYQKGGDGGLKQYLGTQFEIDFAELTDIISKFRNGEVNIFLKRMGREEGEVWYDNVDFAETSILIIEWTHGNNDNLIGVDFPVMLYSTPEETLAHRKARARDKGADSPFVSRVLNIEKGLLLSQAHKAKLIISNDCSIVNEGDLK